MRKRILLLNMFELIADFILNPSFVKHTPSNLFVYFRKNHGVWDDRAFVRRRGIDGAQATLYFITVSAERWRYVTFHAHVPIVERRRSGDEIAAMHYGYLHMVSRELVRELTRPQAEAPRNPYYETHQDTIFVRAGASDISPGVSSTALINVEAAEFFQECQYACENNPCSIYI